MKLRGREEGKVASYIKKKVEKKKKEEEEEG